MGRTARDPETDCVLFQGSKDGSGYGMVWFEGKSQRAHRVILRLTSGEPIDQGLVAMHSCDNPSCVNPKHLSWGTRGDNNTDRAKKGRNGTFKGSSNPAARLTQADVQTIRQRPLSVSKMASQFGVSVTHIKRILNGRSWQASSAG